MSALDVGPFVDALGRWSENVHERAVGNITDRLDEKVPHGSEPTSFASYNAVRETPSLADSVEVTELAPMQTEVAYTKDYASYTDTGSDPHRIDATQTHGWLVFDGGGYTVFVHSVEHPGSPGTRWWTDTFVDDEWGRALEDAADVVVFH